MKAKTFFYANVFAVLKNIFSTSKMQSIVLGSIAFSSAQTSPSPVLCGWEIFQPLRTRVAEGFAEFCNGIVVKTGENISPPKKVLNERCSFLLC
jgi:hypothetical protein